MTSIQVNLPDPAAEFVQRQVTAGEFSTPSEYLSFLVEQARASGERRKLDDLLEEGLQSGEPIPFSAEWWQGRKAALLATLAE